MKKHRRGKVTKKTSRVMALLIALLMITALIVPMGVKASETADGSASGASEAVAEESHEKEEKEEASETEEEKDSSVSDEKKEKSAEDVSTKDTASESGKAGPEEKPSETSSEAETDKVKSSDAAASDSDKKKDDSVEADTDSADKAKTEAEEGKEDSSTGASGESDGASDKKEADQDAQTGQGSAEETAEVIQTSDTTITFSSKDVTVVADRAAFDTEVTMKVKKVTDPEQLLKMVTALNGEGGSYTVKAYNVSFYDKDGKEVEPKIPVQVNVNTKVSAPSKSKVVHVKDDDKTEILDADIDRSGASFEIDSFSDIGVATEAKTKIPGSSFDIYLGEERSDEYTVGDLPAGPISEEDLPVVEGYIYKNATAGDDTVEEIGTITDAEGKVYVYYTTKDENGTLTAEILGEGRIRINLVETEKDTAYDLDADGMHVHVDAPAGAFGAGTYMEISAVELNEEQLAQVQEQAAQVLGEQTGTRIQAVDISFYDETGEKVQPEKPVKVELKTPEAVEGRFCVVHLGDTVSRVESERVKEGRILFEAESFSIYAVVEEGAEEDVSRATVNFYGKDGTTIIATVYVKNSDTSAELKDIIFDPGAGNIEEGELFEGWSISDVNTTNGYNYTTSTEAKTIEDIRDFFADPGLVITEGDVYNIYAMVFNAYAVQYKDEDGITIHSETLVNRTGESVDYTVNMPYTPKEQDSEFQGWNPTTGSDKISAKDGSAAPFENGTEVTLSGDVVLSVVAPPGYWLSFQENGSGATYTPPQFIQTAGDTVTVRPENPTRLGYTFGGWYLNPECTGSQFAFGGKINTRTTLYAKWTPVERANYTVIVWQESTTDTYSGNVESGSRNYDFVKSYTFNGPVNSTVSPFSNSNVNVTDADGTYANVRIRGTTPDNQTINEVYSATGYHAAGYDTGKTIAPEGTTVVNLYYDRNAVTYTFYTYGSSSSGNWILCAENSNRRFTGTIYVRNGNNYTRFNGTPRYGDGNTYYQYRDYGCLGSAYEELVWKQESSGSSWQVYQLSKGLYGEDLDWPTDTSIWWYDDHNGGTATGTRMTYKSAFLPLDSDMTVEYWGTRTTGQGSVHFWIQDVDGGTNYTDAYDVSTTRGTYFSINDKFAGFTAYQYSVDNGPWTNVGAIGQPGTDNEGIYGDPVRYTSRLDIRYNRVKNKITFMDGAYFDGNGSQLDETPKADAFTQSPDYYYQADVSAYNPDGNLYYTPPAFHEGYTFAGWYADDACTQPYDFTTMNESGITVYAKWVQTQYRVFLHPNVPQTDSSLEWAQTNQAMAFRVNYNEKIAGGSMINGERSDYEIIGWYTDEGLKKPFNFDAFVLNDTTVTGEYNKETDFTDPIDKYGIIGSNPSNSDIDRPWVTKKLDLYAKWRSKLEGARGIDVVYDANGGSGAPTDPLQYLDSAEAVAREAATPPDPSKDQFLHWVVQTWNGTAFVDTDTIVYPGGTFEVLKANARREDNPETTGENDRYKYTVQLRAEYGPKEAPKPTHMIWYDNFTEDPVEGTSKITLENLQINQVVDIKGANTFTRPGYTFLGWAKVPSTDENGNPLSGYSLAPKDLTADDLFLKYEDGVFKAEINGAWTEVSQVAADERSPYHDLYAVWDKSLVDITVTKHVTGNMAVMDKSFEFTASLTGGAVFEEQEAGSGVTRSSDKQSVTFSLTDNDSVTITGVPCGASMTITENNADDYDTTAEGITEGSLSGKAYGFTVPEENDEVIFTNNKDATIDTGINLDFLPYLLLIGAVAAGVVLTFRRRREV